jgi:flagellar basal body rod protein FlgB
MVNTYFNKLSKITTNKQTESLIVKTTVKNHQNTSSNIVKQTESNIVNKHGQTSSTNTVAATIEKHRSCDHRKKHKHISTYVELAWSKFLRF